MVINARRDPKFGSEELQVYAQAGYGIGGTVGCLFAGGMLTETDEFGNPAGHPYFLFFIMGIFSAALAVCGLLLPKSMEENQAELIAMGFGERTRTVFREIKQGLAIREIYTTMIFRLIIGTIVPTYVQYLYYYQIRVSGFSQLQYSYLQLIGYLGGFLGSIIYNKFYKESEFRMVLIVACIVNFFGAVTTMLYCLNMTFGIPDFIFVLFTSTVTQTLVVALNFLPTMILYAKIIPERIESSLFAFLMGLLNLTEYFLSPNVGNFFNIWVGCNLDTLAQDTWKLFAIQAGCAPLPCLFIWLVPSRREVRQVQRCLEYLKLYEGKETTQ